MKTWTDLRVVAVSPELGEITFASEAQPFTAADVGNILRVEGPPVGGMAEIIGVRDGEARAVWFTFLGYRLTLTEGATGLKATLGSHEGDQWKIEKQEET